MYEVYALKYSERDTTKCQFFYREASHDKLTLHYFVWLILGGPQPVLVDTGFLDDEAKSRGMRNYVTPASMVERAGVKAADVPISLITHLHYDHWAGHSLFPNAEFWIQQEEAAFWTGKYGGAPGFLGAGHPQALGGLRGGGVRPPLTAGRARHHQDRLNANRGAKTWPRPQPHRQRGRKSAGLSPSSWCGPAGRARSTGRDRRCRPGSGSSRWA